MNTVMGIVGLPQDNKAMLLQKCAAENFELELTNEDTWFLGVDQSTSNAGIALLSANLKYVILLDLHRDKRLDKSVFYRDFYFLLRKLLLDKKVKLVAFEKPVPSGNKQYARSILYELKGRLEEWFVSIPSLTDSYKYPQSWKPYVLDPAKGKGRSKDKQAIASDVVDKFPILTRYFLGYPYSDYDSFDALGILWGVLQAAFDESGYPRIFGDVEKTHVSFVCYKQCTKAELDNPNYVRDLFQIAYSGFNPVFRAYNVNYSLQRNIRMASSSGMNMYTALPDSELGQFQWKFGVDPKDPDKVLLMFVFKRGNLSARELKVLKTIFEWHEEIYEEK